MSEIKEPKKYYEYYYTWRNAEAMRKHHYKNGRDVCDKPVENRTDDKKKWVIWYNREKDGKANRVLPTNNARFYE